MKPEVQHTLISLGAAVGAVVLLLLARFALFRSLNGWCRRHKGTWGELVLGVVRLPSIFWAICLGMMLGLVISPLPERYENPFHVLLTALMIISVTVAISKLCEELARHFLEQSESPMASSGLLKAVIRVAIYTVGILVTLGQLGVQIGPLLTALGVGGAAFALAFKDTAENLFSGIHLLIDRSVEVGDQIKLESGQEGKVIDIGWRTSKITLDEEHLLIIPNTKLAQNITIRKKKTRGSGNQQATLYRKIANN